MVDESSAPPPPANESIDPENNTRLGAKPESGQASSEADGERGFVCECEARMRSACKGEPFYEEHEGKRYCILHCSQKEKGAAFTQAIQRKIDKGDFDFKGVRFPEEADFRGITFTGDVSFFNALFSGTARFARATFSANADFRKATFRQDVDFSSATFEGDTDFGLAFFYRCAHFQHASFGNSLTFSRYSNDLRFTEWTLKAKVLGGPNASLAFDHAKIEHPHKISFNSMRLNPVWFVNVDPSEFTFVDVTWEWLRSISFLQDRDWSIVKDIWTPTEIVNPLFPHPSDHLLAIACRQLAENAESNNRYEEASNFRYWAMDLARRTKWKGWAFWKTDWLHMLYWAVSGYGERIRNALGVLAAVWFVFVLLYTSVGFARQPKGSNESASSATAASMPIEDRIGQPLEFSRALTYSLAVMSLQKPEPKPLTGTAQTLVLLETILGPVQAALLALAIRRKFMR